MTTLRFAQRAKTIKTVVKANVHLSTAELEAIIEELKREVVDLKALSQGLEKQVAWYSGPEYAPGKKCPIALAQP